MSNMSILTEKILRFSQVSGWLLVQSYKKDTLPNFGTSSLFLYYNREKSGNIKMDSGKREGAAMPMLFSRIRDLREDNDKTQKEICEYLFCDQSLYSKYERGLRNVPVEVIIKLAHYYGTSTDYILGLTDSKRAKR